MGYMDNHGAPERKYHAPEAGLIVTDGTVIEGYASLFGECDQGGDIVEKGAYHASLKRLAGNGRRRCWAFMKTTGWAHQP